MYLAIVLTPESQAALKQLIPEFASEWKEYCHHCTITMGTNSKRKYDYTEGEQVEMTVTHIGYNSTNVAVRVTVPKPIKNKIPHVTMSVDTESGGKPFFSNKIERWYPIEHLLTALHTGIYEITLKGVVQLCE